MAEEARKFADDDLMLIDDEDEDTQAHKYLFFRIGKESYGIGIRNIIEIIELQNISEVPDMPGYVKGVINLRGKVIPIVDLRLRFDFPARAYDDRTCIVVTEVDRSYIGLVVDTVEEVMEIPEEKIEPPPRFKSVASRDRYISGMGKVGETVKIIIDVEKVVRAEDAEALPGAPRPEAVPAGAEAR
jgi:purine-binding chemotaxis protein CheW